ncbi:uncharacterized protein LOC134276072 [Saccostrea cucullata]|uniref:uncharacterized protein LOC134276072 n=1 Tax=Saccostrea cuccullata TaxID=36930 RepID=UPI002ED36F65
MLPKRSQRKTGNAIPFLLASTLMGVFFPPILSREDAVISTSTKVVGIVIILYTALSIFCRREEWITHDIPLSGVTKTKIGVLWILGVFKCFFGFIHREINWRCAKNDEYQIVRDIGKFVSVVFTILQSVIILYFHKHSFINSKKIRVVITSMVVTNLTVWLTGLVYCVTEKTSLDNSTYIEEVHNCTYVKENNLETLIRYTDIFRLPFVMEFSVLATVLLISTPITNETETFSVSYSSDFNRYKELKVEENISLTRLQKLSLSLAAFFLCSPFYIFDGVFFMYGYTFESRLPIWDYCHMVTKMVSFLLVLKIFYTLQKEAVIKTTNYHPSFSDVSLLASCFGITATSVVIVFIPEEQSFLSSFLCILNIFHIFYQTILMFFLKAVNFPRRNSKRLTSLKMYLAILICYNITLWLWDFLVYLALIESFTSNYFYTSIYYVFYPLQSFYRFQCAMKMINVYLKL